MPVKSFFREPKTTFRPQNQRDRVLDDPQIKRALLPDEQPDELTQWERDQIAADRAERIRLEEERQKTAAAQMAATQAQGIGTQHNAPEAGTETIEEKINELPSSDAAKLDRLARNTLSNQGVMGAKKMAKDTPSLVKTRREIMRNLILSGTYLSDIEEHE